MSQSVRQASFLPLLVWCEATPIPALRFAGAFGSASQLSSCRQAKVMIKLEGCSYKWVMMKDQLLDGSWELGG